MLEIAEHTNAIESVGTITAFRPFVSAKNPHKCELDIIPEKYIYL